MHEDLAITDAATCANCGYEFGESEAERRVAAYEADSLLATHGRSDRCPECDIQLINWAR